MISNKNAGVQMEHENGVKHRHSDVEHSTIQAPKEKWTPYLFFCVSSIGLASFQDGFQIGCINAPGPLIIEWIKESHLDLFNTPLSNYSADFVWSIAVSMFSIGGMVGSLGSGFLADRLGRRRTLLYNNLLAILAALCLSVAKPIGFYPLIVLGRFLVGVNCGMTSGFVPMYLTELAPPSLRGKCGSFHQLNISIAIVFSQALGLPFIFGSSDNWPLIFACVAIPSIVQLATIPYCAESPKHTVSIDKSKARAALVRLRGHDKVDAELEAIAQEVMTTNRDETLLEQTSYFDLFRGTNRWPLIVAILMMFSQQFSGISAVTFYSTLIFKRNGLTGNVPLYATLGFGCVKLIFTFVCLFLIDHPRFGRKPLHIFGLCGMCASSLLLVVTLTLSNAGFQWAVYLNILFILLFVVAFAFGPGPIPWFFTSEIFDSATRGKAASITASTNWIANWLVGLTFLPINNLIHQYAFLLFTVFTMSFAIFTWKLVPETKGKSPAEIQKELLELRKKCC